MPSNQTTAAVALEGQDVGRDAIEEPAVVTDDDRATGKIEQSVLEGPQGVDVEVVGGLVQQQDVAATLQELGEMDAIALAPERSPTRFCWSLPLKLNEVT